MKYAVRYSVIAYGEMVIEADSPAAAKDVFDTFQCFELYDDSQKAKAKMLSIKPVEEKVID